MSDASALADLQMHWDEAYEIGMDGDIWSARFRGSTDELRAHTSHELRELIRTDYAYRHQASRSGSGRAGTSADAGGMPDDPPRRRSSDRDDEDSYSAHYDSAQYDDGNCNEEDAPAVQPRAGFADIHGERMST
jgi:hypothetical protein